MSWRRCDPRPQTRGVMSPGANVQYAVCVGQPCLPGSSMARETSRSSIPFKPNRLLNRVDPRLQPRLNCIDPRLQHRETGFEALHGHQLIDGFPHDLHDGLGLFGLDARSLESAGSAKCIKRRIGHAGFPGTVWSSAQFERPTDTTGIPRMRSVEARIAYQGSLPRPPRLQRLQCFAQYGWIRQLPPDRRMATMEPSST